MPNLRNKAVQNSNINLLSRLLTMANSTPQLYPITAARNASAHSAVDQIDLPGISKIFLLNLHTTVDYYRVSVSLSSFFDILGNAECIA